MGGPRIGAARTSGEESGEADLSAEQTGAQAPPRFSQPHGDQGRAQGAQRPAGPRSQAAERLSRRTGAVSVERLRKRADFLAAATGPRISAAAFIVQIRERADSGPPRVGFTVSKKVGGAVERNRVRRRLREVVRLSDAAPLRCGNDYVLVGRRAALELPFDRLIADFARALGRIHQERPGTRRHARQGGRDKGRGSGDQKTS
jgi:ribonuclease P protein component